MSQPMRRRDRAVTDPQKIDAIIQSCDCCRVAFATDDAPYIVPLNFGFAWEQGKRVFYFHGAAQGRKIDLLRESPVVGFELDTDHRLNVGDTGCQYSYRFQSVIGTGRAALVEDEAQKRQALCLLLAQYTGQTDWAFPDAMLDRTAVWRMEVLTLSCKEHP
ncbi:MAG: pyridoxamine 5'-phosphate oxidase family protein [Clostridiales bacterium]|nr:pyridoxamine 5'-phosphate oxidase family protein [Clostridiales bacterium]